MFPYKFSLLIFLQVLICSQADALFMKRRGVAVNHVSWLETLRVSQGNVFEESTATFSGIEVSQQMRVDFENKSFMLIDAGLIYGKAEAGNSRSVLGYTAERKNFFGALVTTYAQRKLTSAIVFKGGPGFLIRQAEWTSDDPLTTARSGAQINLLAAVNVEYLLARRLYLDQTFGALMFNGKTFWSIGVGYLW